MPGNHSMSASQHNSLTCVVGAVDKYRYISVQNYNLLILLSGSYM